MSRMKILSSPEEKAFEAPPVFNNSQRHKYFNFPLSLCGITEDLRTPTNKVCFLVMLGYFKATNKFFKRSFYEKDIEFVTKKLNISVTMVNIYSYHKRTYLRHKKVILEHCGFREFDEGDH